MRFVHKTWIEVDQSALMHNLRTVRQLVGNDISMMAIIKANAYGHGLLDVANILKKEKNILLGVDSVEEAHALRKGSIKHPIMILGYIPEPRLKAALQGNFHLSVYSKEVLETIRALLKKNKHLKPHLHLKIETGTNRLGIQLSDLEHIKHFPPIDGIYTHFAEAENPTSQFYQRQLAILQRAKELLVEHGIYPHYFHSAATAALMQFPETHGNLVRLGIGLYGLWPSEQLKSLWMGVGGRLISFPGLKPVLVWKTRIAQIKVVKKGETVGYDRTWRARRPSKIAILPVGYYDGYDRGLSGHGEVLIMGKRAPVIGRVCMNMIMVDVTKIPATRAGDEAVLLGQSGKEKISAEEIAKKIGTINYEVVTRINPLLPRIVA